MIGYFIAGVLSMLVLFGIAGVFFEVFRRVNKLETSIDELKKTVAEQDDLLMEASRLVAHLGVERIKEEKALDLSFPNSEGV